MKTFTLLFLLFTLSILSASARLFSITANLSGNNVVPMSVTGNTGTLTGTFNDATGLLTYSINYSSLPFGRFHSGATGTNGPQIYSFSPNVNPPTNGTVTFSATDIANLLAGKIYVELEYSGTIKIRGQLTSVLIIDTFNESTKNAFYGIGGYSFSQGFFQGGVRPNPDVVSGPSPQNDFSYTVSSTGGIQHVYTYISTLSVNKSITLQFNGNNIRKFGCKATAVNIPTGQATTEPIFFVATTNLGNIANQTAALTEFVGFNVSGNENEYIVSVVASFVNPSTNSIAINNIIIGDNIPQNVALNFDGVDDYVSIPNVVGNFATNQDFTVSCWFRPDPTGTGDQCLIDRWDGTNNISFAFTIRYTASTGTVSAGQYDRTNFPGIGSSTNLKDGLWHHVAFTRNGTTLSLYVDGALIGSVTDNATGTTTNTLPLNIGRQGNGVRYFKGEIDEVRIWTVGKTATEIANERFCKTPNTTSLQAFYNFNNGVPHGNNIFITQIAEASNSVNNGTLNNFAKTGDASNFVTGQVKYVRRSATAGLKNGSSWTNAFTELQSVLPSPAPTCNDLFDVYVATGTYVPDIYNVNINISFNIPSGMRMYGGFAGTEKSLNERTLASIHSTNKTTLSGDLLADDTPFDFNRNRTDNSNYAVIITGNNVVFDGFTVSGAGGYGITINGTNATIKNSRVIDNEINGLHINGDNATIANCSMLGNGVDGINIQNSSATIKECLMANNGHDGILIYFDNGTRRTSIINSTIASNAYKGIEVFGGSFGGSGTSINVIKNSLIYGNPSGGGISTGGSGTINNNITYSLVQGVTTGTGNLNGNTVNPQFVSPLANTVISDLGNYRLKDSSPCINVGDDVGVSPFDLDRNPRPKGGKTDMGAYESNINMNEIISVATGNWESNSTWNLNRIPLATDKVIVNGHQVTVTTNTARAKDLEYKTGAILRYLSGGLLRFGL